VFCLSHRLSWSTELCRGFGVFCSQAATPNFRLPSPFRALYREGHFACFPSSGLQPSFLRLCSSVFSLPLGILQVFINSGSRDIRFFFSIFLLRLSHLGRRVDNSLFSLSSISLFPFLPFLMILVHRVRIPLFPPFLYQARTEVSPTLVIKGHFPPIKFCNVDHILPRCAREWCVDFAPLSSPSLAALFWRPEDLYSSFYTLTFYNSEIFLLSPATFGGGSRPHVFRLVGWT